MKLYRCENCHAYYNNKRRTFGCCRQWRKAGKHKHIPETRWTATRDKMKG